MKNYTITFPLAALGATLLLAGCGNAPPGAPDCEVPEDGSARIVGGAAALSSEISSTGSLRVQGTASHKDGITIRTVSVAGMPATQDESSFNFSRWSIDVPGDVIAAQGTDAETGEVRLAVVAEDACGYDYKLGELSVLVLDGTEPVVDTLDLVATLPEGRDYLPTQTQVPVVLEVLANPEADGATVTLSGEGVALAGADTEGDLRVTLVSPAEDGMATAQVIAYAGGQGNVLVTAQAGGVLTSETFRAVGPPSFAPDGGTLLAGQSIGVRILTEGELADDGCIATPVAGVQVHDGDLDLMLGAKPDSGFTIDVSLGLAEAADVIITCRDVYGQTASALFSVVP